MRHVTAWATAWAWEQDGLAPTTKLVLLALAGHANGDGECWPHHERLIGLTCLSRATFFRCLEELEEAELVRRERVGTRTRYRLQIECLNSRPSLNLRLRGSHSETEGSHGETRNRSHGETASEEVHVLTNQELSLDQGPRETGDAETPHPRAVWDAFRRTGAEASHPLPLEPRVTAFTDLTTLARSYPLTDLEAAMRAWWADSGVARRYLGQFVQDLPSVLKRLQAPAPAPVLAPPVRRKEIWER